MAEQPTPSPRSALPLSAQLRVWHGYIGMLIAPTVLFMAATGILQVYSLHEAHAGYTPPAIIEQLGRVHKDQVFRAPPHRAHDDHEPAHEHADAASPPAPHAAAPQPSQTATLARTALKAFLAIAGGLLIVSTLIGIWMALQQARRRGAYLALLALGALLPALLIALTG